MREVSVLACLLFAMPLAAREVNQAMMVASAPSICDPSAPPVPKASFLSTDPQAILWFVVTGAIQSDMVVADFKTPTGATYPLTANWQPLATSGTYCFTSRTLQISGTDVATMTGTWSARVTINGIMYASVPFNIVANNCTYTLSTMLQTIGGGGGTSSVDVTVGGSNCAAWTATTSTTWITIKSAASNLGTGTVTYSVAANPYAYSRSGVITIAGQSFTVSQSGACTFSLNPTSVSLGSGASGGTVNVTASFQNCAWTAVSNVYWMTLQSVSGSGSGSVSYSVAANTGVPARNGTLTIAGQVFTVNQASGVCTYSLNPTSQSFGSGGGSGSAAVTVTGSNCAPWAAVSKRRLDRGARGSLDHAGVHDAVDGDSRGPRSGHCRHVGAGDLKGTGREAIGPGGCERLPIGGQGIGGSCRRLEVGDYHIALYGSSDHKPENRLRVGAKETRFRNRRITGIADRRSARNHHG